MAKLYLYYASMNAGKSTTLLQADFNYRERGMRTALFTAAVDDRFVAGTISSRIGLSAPATMFDAGTDIEALVAADHAREPLSCVLVDEAQFLTTFQVDQLARIADRHGVPVLAYGLCMAAMNLAFYLSIQRIPIGMAVTFEFLGPLAVAVGGSRRAWDFVWVGLAAAGVAMLGFTPVGNTTVEFERAIDAESKRWAAVVRNRKLSAN